MKANTIIEKRNELQKSAERGEISPPEYQRQLQATWAQMEGSEKQREANELKV